MFRVWLVVAALCWAVPAGAQIVNVQGALAKAPAHDDTSGQVEVKRTEVRDEREPAVRRELPAMRRSQPATW